MKYEGNTELQIDRMVDGELSLAEQRKLLLACDTDNRWRELALAYVESQVLGNALGQSTFLMDSEKHEDEVLTPSSEFRTASRTRNDQSKSTKPRPKVGSQPVSKHWSAWALAAAVMISLGMGYGLGWWWQGVEQGSSLNVAGTPNSSSPDNSQLAKGSTPQTSGRSDVETMPFWVTDANGSELRQVSLPLVNASDLGPNWQQELQQSNLPPEFVQDLRNRGMKLRQQRTLIRARRSDGRLVLVPIDYFYEEPFQ